VEVDSKEEMFPVQIKVKKHT